MARGLPDRWGDQQVEVRRSTRRRRTVTAYRQGELVVVLVPARLRIAEIEQAVADLVPKVLAKETRRRAPAGDAELLERAKALTSAHLQPDSGTAPLPASVRWVSNQSQRWGSCSVTSREIRLSDRLRAMPSWVVDYVLIHELAHLQHADHSPAFWALVARHPMAERARGYLEGWSDRGNDPANVD